MKAIFLILLITIVTMALCFPFNNEGYITIEWLDYHLEIASLLLVIALVSVFIIIFIFTNCLIYLKNIPNSLKKHYKEKQDKDDLLLLLNGFEALCINDISLIKKIYKKIKTATDHQQMQISSIPLGLVLVKAYEAMSVVDKNYEEDLESAYQDLLRHEQTRMVALKGLIDKRLQQKRYHDALFYTEKAFEIDSKSNWVLETLIKIFTELELYEKAEKFIKKSEDLNFIKKEEMNILLISNYIKHAKHCISTSEITQAIQYLEKSLKINAANEEAVFTLARLYSQDGNKKLAQKIIEKAWKQAPSIALAKFLLNIYQDLKVNQKIKLLEGLIDDAKENKAGYLVLAEFYIDMDMIPQARIIMDKLLALHAADSYMSKIMAVIEAKSQNNYSIIINWLYKI